MNFGKRINSVKSCEGIMISVQQASNTEKNITPEQIDKICEAVFAVNYSKRKAEKSNTNIIIDDYIGPGVAETYNKDNKKISFGITTINRRLNTLALPLLFNPGKLKTVNLYLPAMMAAHAAQHRLDNWSHSQSLPFEQYRNLDGEINADMTACIYLASAVSEYADRKPARWFPTPIDIVINANPLMQEAINLWQTNAREITGPQTTFPSIALPAQLEAV